MLSKTTVADIRNNRVFYIRNKIHDILLDNPQKAWHYMQHGDGRIMWFGNVRLCKVQNNYRLNGKPVSEQTVINILLKYI